MVVATHTYAVFMRCIVGMEDESGERERSRRWGSLSGVRVTCSNQLPSISSYLSKHKIVPTTNDVSKLTCYEFGWGLTNVDLCNEQV